MATRARVAVVAHSGKTFGGGLPAVRKALAAAGYEHPLWFEVPKSKKAGKAVRRAIKEGAELLFVWGGDGMVQRCIDAAVGRGGVALAILPAGTANLLATDLGIPKDIARAVAVGLGGERRKLDVGTVNGERFAVMAGIGLDANIMEQVSGARKKRLGRAAYLRSGVRAMNARPVRVQVRVDGARWFDGKASCVLLGNIGRITGGLHVFEEASPTDGLLEVGVVTAKNAWQWMRVFSRIVRGRVRRSPFVNVTRGKKIRIRIGRKIAYELDGGARSRVKRIVARVQPGALTVCVPPRRRVHQIAAPPPRRAA